MFLVAPQLLNDSVVLGDFTLSRLLLCNDRHYPWFILVPRRDGIREIFELSAEDQSQLLWESSYLSQQLNSGFGADKMNIAALGNQVPQLHLHHIVRYQNDSAWPGPVWGKVAAEPYTESELANMHDRINMLLTDQFEPVDLA